MNINYINYATLGMMKSNQVGSTQTGDENEFNYKNGLNKKELAVIDVNGDGAITETEFKDAFGGTDDEAYKKYWQTYSQYYTASTNSDGKTTQTKNGIKTESTFDGEKMTGYTQTKVNKDGSIEVKTYNFNSSTGLYEVTKIETKYQDGVNLTNNSDGSTEVKLQDIVLEKYNRYGQLEYASSTIATYDFEYNQYGYPLSVTIKTIEQNEDKGEVIQNSNEVIEDQNKDKTYENFYLINNDGEIFDPNNSKHKINDFKIVFYELDEENKAKELISLQQINGKFVVTDNISTNESIESVFGPYNTSEIVEKTERDKDNKSKVTIKTTCHDLVLKEKLIEMQDGMPIVNETHEYTYSLNSDSSAAYISEEIIKDHVSNNTTTLLYKENSSDTPYFTSVRNSKGKIIEAEGTLEGVLQQKYPNLSTIQIKQLAEECATVNQIDTNAMVKFDPVTNDYNLEIPKFKINPETDNVVFVQGTVLEFIKKLNPNLTEKQLTQLSEECRKINNVNKYYNVTYDPEENVYSIVIPEYRIKVNGDLEFIYEEEE